VTLNFFHFFVGHPRGGEISSPQHLLGVRETSEGRGRRDGRARIERISLLRKSGYRIVSIVVRNFSCENGGPSIVCTVLVRNEY